MGQKMPKIPIDFDLCPKESCYYTLVTAFNMEKKVARDIYRSMSKYGYEELIDEIYIPYRQCKKGIFKTMRSCKYTYSKKKIYKGKQIKKHQPKFRLVNKLTLPLYVFIKCKMNGDLYWFLRNTTGCVTVLATGNSLATLTEEEMDRIRANATGPIDFMA